VGKSARAWSPINAHSQRESVSMSRERIDASGDLAAKPKAVDDFAQALEVLQAKPFPRR